jgi:Response regulator containing CheY-like receiver, AAA-type ATPase, and DNA-binding domains
MKTRILIVEDDEGVQEYVRNTLTGAGYESEIARDGEEAIAVMNKSPFGLVILDLFMPKLGGFQTIARLKQECPTAKVLAISGGGHYPIGDALLVAKRIGAHGTLQKPFTPQQLLAEVTRLVSGKEPTA